MKRLIGFLMFWTGVGIFLGLLIPNTFLAVLTAGLLLLAGYNLFCAC
ncbi:MAG TPA: hypothetical protein IAB71_09625 [Candidatus Scatomonas pullistercoris]|uniref:DUF2892 domain-containing protein n=1 Tax=Candidatus Scatomonas pullistercoris TaxID=2840920 RepID=A0A9D1P4Z5_9FIRM|nr:hypothetical protein [Candidatus Scatomonas pullistercoris]